MKSKKVILTLTLATTLVALTGCFGFTESLLATLFPQPKNEAKEEEPKIVPVVQGTVVIQGRTLSPNRYEYRWWYTGYNNFRQPYLRFPHSLWWYNTGRWCWWQDNIDPLFWPVDVPKLVPRPQPKRKLLIVEERNRMLPGDTKAQIDAYVDRGVPPSGFLHAVLSNNLFEAVSRAAGRNRLSLADICDYIRCYTPTACHGSSEEVNAWLILHHNEPEIARGAAASDYNRRASFYLMAERGG